MSKIFVKDPVVFITGSSRAKGIGRALVEEAIKRGAKKVYATARDRSQLDDLVKKFQGKVIAVELDVTNTGQIQKVAQSANDTQILINNAGVASAKECLSTRFHEKAKMSSLKFEG